MLKATPGGSGITFYITMALAAGTIAVQLIMPGHAATGTTLKVIAIAVIALLTVGFFALGRYSARSQAKQTTERIYLVNEDGLATIDRDLNQTVDWSLIRRAVTKGDVILLYNQAGTIAVAMPHRHVGGPERLHELDALIRRKVADCSQL